MRVGSCRRRRHPLRPGLIRCPLHGLRRYLPPRLHLPPASRPFADEDPSEVVARQARERDRLFAQVADLTVDTGESTVPAVVALIQNVAAEVKDLGITANVVLPSTIDTPANRAAMPTADFTKWVAPQSIGKLLLWLASDAAADTSGAVIPIYGRA